MRNKWLLIGVGICFGLGNAQAPQGSVLLRLNSAEDTVLVGTFSGKWQNAEEVTRLQARDYQVYGPTGRINQAKGAGGLTPPPDICDWNRLTPLTLTERKTMLYPAYAVSAPWNPQPRLVTALTPTQAHRSAIQAELTKGKSKAAVVITQALRVDLDGDKRDEVILTANNPSWKAGDSSVSPAYGTKAGNYGMVMVRKLLNDTDLRTFVLGSDILQKDDEAQRIATNFRIGAILDLDGDGKMEIVLDDWVYEGHGTTVWRWDGKGFVKVLEWGCGV